MWFLILKCLQTFSSTIVDFVPSLPLCSHTLALRWQTYDMHVKTPWHFERHASIHQHPTLLKACPILSWIAEVALEWGVLSWGLQSLQKLCEKKDTLFSEAAKATEEHSAKLLQQWRFWVTRSSLRWFAKSVYRKWTLPEGKWHMSDSGECWAVESNQPIAQDLGLYFRPTLALLPSARLG